MIRSAMSFRLSAPGRVRLVAALAIGLGALFGTIPSSQGGTSVSFDDLLGKWCGEATNYVFDRKSLTVTFHAHGNRRVLAIDHVEEHGDWINVVWADGNTIFWEFSRDKRVMFQAENTSGDNGPRLRFRRC